ncbi:nuclear transport factor 2 family protein [Marinimicrobium sp. ABcell2]|uniref:nuclear transport factor 2 family protein n=1 Tax=Marinimicrobium sp. ABcell2 TaxID=3069751 RepID=UPI0027B337A8|nr:nuclear transport factor 2 family protein [Marinimicrobium sp. ABcell2]MDQ2076802.1 nuclear transport factor 2 family protein [Marinimicrobium sp. ABcell2]
MSTLIEQVKEFYRVFNSYSSEHLSGLYHPQVTFTDPVHQIQGIDALDSYLRAGLANVTECRFAFHGDLVTPGRAALPWTMTFAHPKLNKGELITVPGLSLLEFDTKILAQQDFYDMGAMVYEQVPILRSVVRSIRHRMQS